MYILKRTDNETIVINKKSGKSRKLSKEEENKIAERLSCYSSERLIPFNISQKFGDIIEHVITKEDVDNSFFIFPEKHS